MTGSAQIMVIMEVLRKFVIALKQFMGIAKAVLWALLKVILHVLLRQFMAIAKSSFIGSSKGSSEQ